MSKCKKCGHEEREHTVAAGPNSIGEHFFNLCGHNAAVFGIYVVRDCQCSGFKKKHWWNRSVK